MNEDLKRDNRRKFIEGVVVSDRMQKTRVVQVRWSMMHSKYHKVIRRASRYKAHDEKNASRIGDTVRLMETRPLSKDKRWIITDVVKHA